MVTLGMLWLPILLSAAAAWILNALFWTASPHHKADWRPVAEGRLMAALQAGRPTRGMYYVPAARASGAASEAEASPKEGSPSMYLIVPPQGGASMGRAMALSLLLNVAVAVLAAYAAGVGLAPGAPYLDVFRLVMTVVFLAYAAARFSESIWFGYSWSSTWKSAVDATIIGLVTGGIFGWLWPQ